MNALEHSHTTGKIPLKRRGGKYRGTVCGTDRSLEYRKITADKPLSRLRWSHLASPLGFTTILSFPTSRISLTAEFAGGSPPPCPETCRANPTTSTLAPSCVSRGSIMSMDDPGWGEEIPDEPSPSTSAKKSTKSSGGGLTQPSRNQLIAGGAVVIVIIVVFALLVTGGKKPKNDVTTTTANHSARTTTPTTSASAAITAAGKSYLGLENPAYDSLTAFGSVVSGWTTNAPTADSAQAAANPTITAFKTFSNGLQSTTWPALVQPEVNTLSSQVEVVANDLGGLGLAIASGTNQQWATTFESDSNTLVTDVNAVRAKLNLPALATS
jgi:hypothetical protein